LVLLAVVSLAVIGASSVAAASAPIQLGPFAGYVWDSGPVSELGATFTVPRIEAGSPAHSFAGSWIGAQAPGVNGPFIQIGVNEVRLDYAPLKIHRIDYYAFWSDTRLHFRPVGLFVVRPGDQIAVSLQLVHGGWKLAIVDATSDVARRFSTPDEAHGVFNLGEFLQEDVSHATEHVPFPYPRLAGVRFSKLRVDWQTPGRRQLLSQWMTMQRGDLAPTLLGPQDSFSVRGAQLGVEATRYRRLAAQDDSAVSAFDASVQHWNARTPRTEVEAASATFAAAIRLNIRLLAQPAWPRRLRPYVTALIARQLALLRLVEAAPQRAEANLVAWETHLQRDGDAISRAALALKAQTHGPELVA